MTLTNILVSKTTVRRRYVFVLAYIYYIFYIQAQRVLGSVLCIAQNQTSKNIGIYTQKRQVSTILPLQSSFHKFGICDIM